MIDDLYSTRILTLAANMPHAGRLPLPHGTGEQVAKLCGSKAIVDVRIDGNSRISEFAQEVKACALGQAAAALVGEVAVGATLAEVREARDDMLLMLKHGGDGPEGRFEGLRAMKQVADYPARHASTMTGIEALLKALEEAMTTRLDSCVLGSSPHDEIAGEHSVEPERTTRAGRA
jgi:NifU-like protein involved in Fe-S cluster formation